VRGINDLIQFFFSFFVGSPLWIFDPTFTFYILGTRRMELTCLICFHL